MPKNTKNYKSESKPELECCYNSQKQALIIWFQEISLSVVQLLCGAMAMMLVFKS